MTPRPLTDALDRLAPRQPFADDWADVLTRAGVEATRPSRSGWRARKWVLAAAIVSAIVVPVAAATIAATNDWWFFRDYHGSPALTEPVVIKTSIWDGKRWQLVAFRTSDDRYADPSAKEYCVGVMPYASPPSASTGGALGCGGFIASGGRGINFALSQSSEVPHWGAGPVVDSASEVALYFRNGDVLRVPTYPAPDSFGPVHFYAAALPTASDPAAERPVKVVGISKDGVVVACAPLDSSARC
jgi:hypothetical protein